MIVKVSGGGRDFGGLAAYLWGGGKAEEHTEQRMIASTGADLPSAICGAIGAFSGPLHGGAPDRALHHGRYSNALHW